MILHTRPFIYLLILLLCTGTLSAQQRADFIIIQNSSALKILNQYQMSLPENHPLLQVSNAPLQLIERNILLSDELTRAMKVGFMGYEYFLLLDEKGKLNGVSNAGSAIELKRCATINDTIRIVNERIFLSPQPILTSDIATSKGEIFTRIFKKNNLYALMRPGTIPEFYWSSLTPSSGWEKVQKTTEIKAEDNTQLDKRIIEKFRNVTNIYQAFFTGFNEQFEQSVNPPRWEIDQDSKSITATLLNMDKSRLQQSNRALINDLSYLIMGSRYTISQTGTTIIIYKNGGS